MIKAGLGNIDTHKFPVLATMLNLNVWPPIPVNNPEGGTLDSGLDLGVGELATNESFHVEDTGMAYH